MKFKVYGVCNLYIGCKRDIECAFLENHILLGEFDLKIEAEDFVKNIKIGDLNKFICVYIQEV